MKRFSIPPREERERHSHTMSAYVSTSKTLCLEPRNKVFRYSKQPVSRHETVTLPLYTTHSV
jgi:hypothetical protein